MVSTGRQNRKQNRQRTGSGISAAGETRAAALTCDRRLLVLGALQVLLHQFGRHADHVLALPVLDHVERLQRADDVTLRDAGHLTGRGRKKTRRGGVRAPEKRRRLISERRVCVPEVLDGQRSPEVPQDLQQDPRPVAPVAQLPEIRQRLLRRADGVLQLRQLVTCTQTTRDRRRCDN